MDLLEFNSSLEELGENSGYFQSLIEHYIYVYGLFKCM